MISQNGQIKESFDSIFMFVHSIDATFQHRINLLSLQPNELPKLVTIFEFKASPIIQMQRWDDFLITLDENLHVRRFKHSVRTGKLRVYKDSDLSDEAQTMLQFY